MTADDIRASCRTNWPLVPHDCNLFVKAVAADCFNVQPFGAGLNADAIIGYLSTPANGWTDLAKSSAQAIASAVAGNVVVAGMTGAAMGQAHGHVAIVVNVQPTGGATAPIGFAKSLRYAGIPYNQEGAYEAINEPISKTFRPTYVANGNVSYFSMAPTK